MHAEDAVLIYQLFLEARIELPAVQTRQRGARGIRKVTQNQLERLVRAIAQRVRIDHLDSPIEQRASVQLQQTRVRAGQLRHRRIDVNDPDQLDLVAEVTQ